MLPASIDYTVISNGIDMYSQSRRPYFVFELALFVVLLPHHEIHEVLRQERALETRDRQQAYRWRKVWREQSRVGLGTDII